MSFLSRQQCVKLARTFERLQIIAAANMVWPNENLWHSAAAIGTLHHGLTLGVIATHVNLRKADILAFQ
jgi:hypothetical protein